jgi:hypothetical protein
LCRLFLLNDWVFCQTVFFLQFPFDIRCAMEYSDFSKVPGSTCTHRWGTSTRKCTLSFFLKARSNIEKTQLSNLGVHQGYILLPGNFFITRSAKLELELLGFPASRASCVALKRCLYFAISR